MAFLAKIPAITTMFVVIRPICLSATGWTLYKSRVSGLNLRSLGLGEGAQARVELISPESSDHESQTVSPFIRLSPLWHHLYILRSYTDPINYKAAIVCLSASASFLGTGAGGFLLCLHV